MVFLEYIKKYIFIILLLSSVNIYGQEIVCYKEFNCNIKKDTILKMVNIYKKYQKHINNEKYIYLLKYKKNKDTIYVTITADIYISVLLEQPPVCYFCLNNEFLFIQHQSSMDILKKDTTWLKKVYLNVLSIMSFDEIITSFNENKIKCLEKPYLEFDPNIILFKIYNNTIINYEETPYELFYKNFSIFYE